MGIVELNNPGLLGVRQCSPGRLLSRDRFATPICGAFSAGYNTKKRICVEKYRNDSILVLSRVVKGNST